MQRSCLVLLAVLGAASALQFQSGPDVAAEVAAQSAENIQIHDGFASQEKKDDQNVKEVKANKDLSALQTSNWMVALDKDMKTQMLVEKSPAVKDACGSITCGALKCPGGFTATEVEGHCCPYCVNPNIKVEAAVTGATGSNGGKASTFCPEVWCFPTMCAKAISNPTGSNGQCCPMCS